MSTLKDRAAARLGLVAARLALVPPTAVPGYAAAMASVPRVKLVPRRVGHDRDLPAVGSFD